MLCPLSSLIVSWLSIFKLQNLYNYARCIFSYFVSISHFFLFFHILQPQYYKLQRIIESWKMNSSLFTPIFNDHSYFSYRVI